MRLSPKLRKRYFYTVPAAGKQVGHSRAEAYRAAGRGDIPTIKQGRLLLVPRKQWDRIKDHLRDSLPMPRKMTAERPTAAKRREREAAAVKEGTA